LVQLQAGRNLIQIDAKRQTLFVKKVTARFFREGELVFAAHEIAGLFHRRLIAGLFHRRLIAGLFHRRLIVDCHPS